MLSANRNKVAIRMTTGKAENSRGRVTRIAINRINTEIAKLKASRRSNNAVGIGTTIMMTTPMISAGTPMVAMLLAFTAPLVTTGSHTPRTRERTEGLTSYDHPSANRLST